MLQLLARREEELRGAQAELLAAQQRNVQLENDNVQLQARVSGERGRGTRLGGTRHTPPAAAPGLAAR